MKIRVDMMFAKIVLLLSVCVDAAKLDKLSFQGPFETVASNGVRQVGEEWNFGGSSVVMKNFVRLTPDRQSKKGYIWSKNAIQSNEVTAVLTFRISGLGEKWFGDGIGLWFSQSPNYISGDNHGYAEKYTGVGIILDTFHNSDHHGGHKDISVMVNDGTKDLDTLNSATKVGCDASMRFHEKHAGFNAVYSSSRVKVSIKGKSISIKIDEKNTGEWKDCYSADIDLPANWLQNVHVGTTAATGSLADNHDILRLEVFSLADDVHASVSDSESLVHNMGKDYDKWIDDASCTSDCKLTILQKKIKDFQVDFEHQMADLKEKTQNTVAKLREREAANENKIEDLEKIVSGMVDRTMNTQMIHVGEQINNKIDATVKNKVTASSGWKIPFFLLFTSVGGGSFFLYKKYQQLMKSHLL